jgi:hypothetical protein
MFERPRQRANVRVRQHNTDFRTVTVRPDYWGAASGLIVAIGACAPIHPRVGQSGPPGPCVRAGSLWGHIFLGVTSFLASCHRSHDTLCHNSFAQFSAYSALALRRWAPIPRLSLWRLIMGQSWAAQVRARHGNGRKFIHIYTGTDPHAARDHHRRRRAHAGA